MQTSFCKSLTLSVLALVSMQQVNAHLVVDNFKAAGAKSFTVHGVFRDLVVKTALHNFVTNHLPNQHFFNLRNTTFNLHDVFNALADAAANIADDHFMTGSADSVEAVRVAFAGNFAHKLWEALLDVLGVAEHVGQDVKDNYDKYGKAWFSEAFGRSLNEAFGSLLGKK